MSVRASLVLTSLAIALGLAPRGSAAEPAAAAAPAAPETIKVGIMEGMFRGVPAGLVKAGGDQFGGLFKKITGLPGEVESEANHLDLAKKLTDNKTHLGVLHGFEWAWVSKKNPDLVPLAITIPPHLPQAAIIVNANNPVAGPNMLKGANIDVPFNMKAHGFVYIENLQKGMPNAFKIAPSADQSMDELLEGLGKGQNTAVLVDAGSFAAFQGNNPGKAQKFKVLSKSVEMPQTVIVYNKKHLPPNVVNDIQVGLLGANKNPQGKAFLFVWNLKGFEKANPGFDKLVADCLAAFPPPEKK